MKILPLAAILLGATGAAAHRPITTQVTWHGEVAALVQRHCAPCHNPSGSSFSLQTYTEARPWAKAIRDAVLERTMPPWPAAPGIGDFANDPSLPRYAIDLLVSWAEGGAPEGEA